MNSNPENHIEEDIDTAPPKDSWKKKLIPSGWSELTTKGKAIWVILMSAGIIFITNIVLSITNSNSNVEPNNEFLAPQADASIVSMSGTETEEQTETFEAERNKAEEAKIEQSKEKKLSFGQDLTLSENNDEEEGHFSINLFSSASKSDSEQDKSNDEPVEESQFTEDQLNRHYEALVSKLRSEQPRQVAPGQLTISSNRNLTATLMASNQRTAMQPLELKHQDEKGEYKKRPILPADKIICRLRRVINTDNTTDIGCDIVDPGLEGATVLLKVSRKEELAILETTTLIYGNNTAAISAIAIDLETGFQGVADNVDNHRLFRWGSLIAAGAADAAWNMVQTPKKEIVVGDNQTTVTQEEFSDRDFLIATVSRPVSLVTEQLTENFNKPPTVTTKDRKLIQLLILNKVDEKWLPDMRNVL